MILFVAAESPWPSRSGGRLRMAGLVAALSTLAPVTVAVARGRRGGEVPPEAEALPACGRGRAAALLGRGPFLGRGLLDAAGAQEVQRLSRGADAVVVSHSYLAAQLGPLAAPVVVDLQNVEAERQRDAGTLLGRVEAAKARRWERDVVRRTRACVCVDEQDAATALAWGAPEVVVVRNVEPAPVSPASPADGPVLAVADWLYGPNAEGARELLALWPRVRERVPGARLVLAGRGSEALSGPGVEGLGFVDDLDPLYDRAAAVVSPVRRGAGTQLKVAAAVARGRVVVTTPHGERSLPDGAREACWSGDLVDGLVHVLTDVDDRHRREAVLRALPAPSWERAAAPLLRLLEGLDG